MFTFTSHRYDTKLKKKVDEKVKAQKILRPGQESITIVKPKVAELSTEEKIVEKVKPLITTDKK